MGELHREWDELEDAEEHLIAAIEHATRGGLSGALLWAQAYLALVQQALGRADAANATVARAGEYLEPGDSYGAACLGMVEALLRLGQGDLDAAARWASTAQPAPSEVATISVGRRDIEYVAFIRVWLAEAAAGRKGAHLAMAHDLIQRMLEPAEAAQRTGRVLELLALRAVAHDLAGQRREGYRRAFLELGPPMARLLEALLRFSPTCGYASTLLGAFGVPASVQPTGVRELLSARELDVLRWMALGASNQRIADELVVALATVKTHVNAVFRKLGVASRVEAIVRARELGLL
jgi:LuxR family maltose regulon positive regulatory protein